MKKTIGLIGALLSLTSAFCQNDDVEFNSVRISTLHFKTTGKYLHYNTGGDYADFGTISNGVFNGNYLLHAANFNSYAPTLTGIGASGIWGINISGNANSSTLWGGLTSDFSTYANSVDWLAGFEGGNVGKIKPVQASQIKALLGIPSGGETLQSITGRAGGNTTSTELILRTAAPGSGISLQIGNYYEGLPDVSNWLLNRRGDNYFSSDGRDLIFWGDRAGGYRVPLIFRNNGDVLLASNLNATGGNVGIGTANPQSKLAVNGTITTTKIKVTQEGWADYVFDSSYQLAPLSQVERFVRTNKHLPDVPSAAEVKKEGLNLGDNQAVLLKKIEELTLYIIDQNKRVEGLEKQVKALSDKK